MAESIPFMNFLSTRQARRRLGRCQEAPAAGLRSRVLPLACRSLAAGHLETPIEPVVVQVGESMEAVAVNPSGPLVTIYGNHGRPRLLDGLCGGGILGELLAVGCHDLAGGISSEADREGDAFGGEGTAWITVHTDPLPFVGDSEVDPVAGLAGVVGAADERLELCVGQERG